MYILLVEDDPSQREEITRALRTGFPGARIDQIKAEFDFHSHLEAIAKDPPDVIIMDVWMKPFDRPSEDTDTLEGMRPPPPEEAGLRCERAVTEAKIPVPVILYTILEPADLEGKLPPARPTLVHLAKVGELEPLIQEIRRSVRHKSNFRHK